MFKRLNYLKIEKENDDPLDISFKSKEKYIKSR